MDTSAKTIPYATMVIITRARELIKSCEHADKCLADVSKFIGEDTMLTEQEKEIVLSQAVNTREVLQKSILMYGKVVRRWER